MLARGRLLPGQVVKLARHEVLPMREQATWDAHRADHRSKHSCGTPYQGWSRKTGEVRRSACGKCVDCRRMRSRELMFRAASEIAHAFKSGGSAYIATLTFDRHHLPDRFEPASQVSIFTDRVGKSAKRQGVSARFLNVAEEGGRRGRPHWHCICCFDGPFDWKDEEFVVGAEKQTSRYWEQGFTHIEAIEEFEDPYAVSGYLLGYVFKGVSGNKWVKKDPLLFTVPGRRMTYSHGRNGNIFGYPGLLAFIGQYLAEETQGVEIPLRLPMPRRRGQPIKSHHRQTAPLTGRYRQRALGMLDAARREMGWRHDAAYRIENPGGLSWHDLEIIRDHERKATAAIEEAEAKRAREIVWEQSPYYEPLPPGAIPYALGVRDNRVVSEMEEAVEAEKRRLSAERAASEEIAAQQRYGAAIGGLPMEDEALLWQREYGYMDSRVVMETGGAPRAPPVDLVNFRHGRRIKPQYWESEECPF